MDILKLVKLTPRQFSLAVLLLSIGWLSNQVTQRDAKIDKSTQRSESREDSLQSKVNKLEIDIRAHDDSCYAEIKRKDVEIKGKDAEMKNFLKSLLDEQKEVNRQASKSEQNVDRAINQAKNAIKR